MKKIIFVISIFAAFQVQAQTPAKVEDSPKNIVIYKGSQTVIASDDKPLVPERDHEPKDQDLVYTFVEQEPIFQGGDRDNAKKWIQERLIYPAIARENGLQGKVFITFVVNKAGKTEDITVAKDNVGGGCAEEAMRVIRSMPEWSPGKQNNNPVSVKITLPFVFKLEDPKPEEVKH
jgi:TonB family protein